MANIIQVNTTALSSNVSVVNASEVGGAYTLDATGSIENGVVKGGLSGFHRYAFTRNLNTVDIGGARTPINIVAGGNVTVNGVDVEKNVANNAWNASFYSAQAFDPLLEDFAVSWLVESVTGTIREMGGLDDNPSANNSYNSIDYAAYQVNNYFNTTVYEKGASTAMPGYVRHYFQVGDRIGVKCIDGVVTYFTTRAGVEKEFYTSAKRATVPLYFKGAFSRTSAEGHVMGGVEWHSAKIASPSTVHLSGASADIISDADKESLVKIGLVIASGSTYSKPVFSLIDSDKYKDSGAQYPLSLTHGYAGTYGETSQNWTL